MWPMCSEPVTFGGGMAIDQCGRGSFTSARKSFSSNQYVAQRSSISCGSYALGISRVISAAAFHIQFMGRYAFARAKRAARRIPAANREFFNIRGKRGSRQSTEGIASNSVSDLRGVYQALRQKE